VTPYPRKEKGEGYSDENDNCLEGDNEGKGMRNHKTGSGTTSKGRIMPSGGKREKENITGAL